MPIEKRINGETMKISLEGRLDSEMAPLLDEELKASLNGIEELIFDLKKLDYISSAGLRVLLNAQKTMAKQGTMKVINPGELVREVFDVTGFSNILTIER